MHIQPLLIRGWGKTGPAHSFPTPSESINLVQKLNLGGEKLFFGHQPYPVMNTTSESINLSVTDGHENTIPLHKHSLPGGGGIISLLMFYAYSGQGNLRLAEFFPTPVTICTTVFPHVIALCIRLMFNHVRVGKELAGQVFPEKKQRLHVYS